MSNNYPAGAEHDSRAPYNQEDYDISDIVSEVRGALAEELPDFAFDIIREYASGETALNIYEVIFEDLKKTWEH